MHLTYKHTRYACYAGYITQAIINNLAPLLFIIFQIMIMVYYVLKLINKHSIYQCVKELLEKLI